MSAKNDLKESIDCVSEFIFKQPMANVLKMESDVCNLILKKNDECMVSFFFFFFNF